MKSLLLLLPLLYSSSLLCQLYIPGIAPDSIDRKYEAFDLMYLQEAKSSLKIIRSVEQYWKQEKDKNSTLPNMQNYIRVVMLRTANQIMVEGFTPDIAKVNLALEDEILNSIGPDNLCYAEYCKHKAFFLMSARKDYNGASKLIDYAIEWQSKLLGDMHPDLAEVYLFKGEIDRKAFKLEESIQSFQRCLQILDKHPLSNTRNRIEAEATLGTVYYYKHDYEKTKEIYESVYSKIKNLPTGTCILEPIVLLNLANTFRNLQLYEKGLQYAELSLKYATSFYEKESQNLATPYTNLGVAHASLGNYESFKTYTDSAIYILKKNKSNKRLAMLYGNKAEAAYNLNERISNYKKALKLCPDDPRCSSKELASFYNGISNAYIKKGKTSIGLSYLEKARSNASENPIATQGKMANTYQLIANQYFLEKENEKAFSYLLKIDSINQRIFKNTLKEAHGKAVLAAQYQKSGDSIKAAKYYQSASKIVAQFPQIKNKTIAECYHQMAKYHQLKGNHKNAIVQAEKTIEIYNRLYNAKHSKVNERKLFIAKSYLESNNKKDCRKLLDQILLNCSINFSQPNFNNTPSIQLWNQFNILEDYLKIEEKLGGLAQSDLIERVEYGITLGDHLRKQYFFESEEIEIQQRINAFYDWSINQLYAQLNETNIDEIHKYIFTCIEKSKSINLNRNFSRVSAMTTQEVPVEIIKTEKNLIHKFQKNLEQYYSSQSEQRDSIITALTNEMLTIEDQKNKFLEELEINYPSYYQKRYKQITHSLEDLKTHSKTKNEGIVLFHVTEEHIYRFYVSPTEYNLKRILRSEVTEDYKSLNTMLFKRNGAQEEKNYNQEKETFVTAASNLYQIYFGDVHTLPTKLSIITDNFLTGFPFGILLMNDSNDASLTYNQLPYLITQSSISYQGSVSQKLQSPPININRKYIGFGPSYDSSNSTINRESSEPPLSLTYNISEIENTSKFFGGGTYLKEKATKQAFLNNAAKANILHLAMHAYADVEIPSDSYLSFAKDTSDQNYSRLHAYEIAQLELGNDLVVLSACETNKSSKNEGEGILGIARAFQLASCPNIIMSNWLINDNSASKIIYYCFENISDGNDVPIALQQAKLKYLNESSTMQSHPSYWAGFTFYGQHTAQTKQKFPSIPLLVGCLSLLILIPIGIKYLK